MKIPGLLSLVLAAITSLSAQTKSFHDYTAMDIDGKEISMAQFKGKKILVDENGYLANQNDWNEEVAIALAAHEGINSLSREQMDIINFMREYFLKYKVFPILNNVCRIARTHRPAADRPGSR
jgi:TusE/DsrC/DsvC family sulfur relay protein